VIVALGDSLTAGYGLRPSEAYPAILQERLTGQGYRVRVVNAGVSGDTTAGGLRRREQALTGDVRILILALGVNDGLRGVPIQDITRNLSTIIETAQSRGISVLLCGIDTPPQRGISYTFAFHNIFPELAVRYHLPLVPFLLTGVLGDPKLNLGDGVHPNAAGARVIADTVWPYLRPLVESVLTLQQ
jgi:acyl-CoA thioesterase-1